MYKGILKKTSDNVFNGNHPNGIDEGNVIVGVYNDLPEVGHSFFMAHSSDRIRQTTKVTEILQHDVEKIIFKTKNSTYILEFLDEKDIIFV